VPDGEYKATVTRFDFIEKKSNGELMLEGPSCGSPAAIRGLSGLRVAFPHRDRSARLTKGYLELLGLEAIQPFFIAPGPAR